MSTGINQLKSPADTRERGLEVPLSVRLGGMREALLSGTTRLTVTEHMGVVTFMDSIGVAMSFSGALQLFSATSIKGRTDADTLNSAFHAADILCIAAALFTLSLVACSTYQMQADMSAHALIIRLIGRMVWSLSVYLSIAGFALIGYALMTFNETWGSVMFYGAIGFFVFQAALYAGVVFLQMLIKLSGTSA